MINKLKLNLEKTEVMLIMSFINPVVTSLIAYEVEILFGCFIRSSDPLVETERNSAPVNILSVVLGPETF